MREYGAAEEICDELREVYTETKPGAHGRVALFYPETTEDILIELCEI